ncbi:hypothetical protein HK101_003352, partial [Irineochytrium annulatum]
MIDRSPPPSPGRPSTTLAQLPVDVLLNVARHLHPHDGPKLLGLSSRLRRDLDFFIRDDPIFALDHLSKWIRLLYPKWGFHGSEVAAVEDVPRALQWLEGGLDWTRLGVGYVTVLLRMRGVNLRVVNRVDPGWRASLIGHYQFYLSPPKIREGLGRFGSWDARGRSLLGIRVERYTHIGMTDDFDTPSPRNDQMSAPLSKLDASAATSLPLQIYKLPPRGRYIPPPQTKAVEKLSRSILTCLLNRWIDPSANDHFVFRWAATTGANAILDFLLAPEEPAPSTPTSALSSPSSRVPHHHLQHGLFMAARQGHPDTIRLLLAACPLIDPAADDHLALYFTTVLDRRRPTSSPPPTLPPARVTATAPGAFEECVSALVGTGQVDPMTTPHAEAVLCRAAVEGVGWIVQGMLAHPGRRVEGRVASVALGMAAEAGRVDSMMWVLEAAAAPSSGGTTRRRRRGATGGEGLWVDLGHEDGFGLIGAAMNGHDGA